MGKIKVWFGWALWLIAIALGLMLLIAQFDLFGNEWIDFGLIFVVNKLSEFNRGLSKIPTDMWQMGGAGFCLSAIMIVVLILMWLTRPRFWLKCPNCNTRGWILNQDKYGDPYKTRGGFFPQKRQMRTRWNLCARCNHKYGYSEKEIGYDEGSV